jgi:hypothetical protein
MKLIDNATLIISGVLIGWNIVDLNWMASAGWTVAAFYISFYQNRKK